MESLSTQIPEKLQALYELTKSALYVVKCTFDDVGVTLSLPEIGGLVWSWADLEKVTPGELTEKSHAALNNLATYAEPFEFEDIPLKFKRLGDHKSPLPSYATAGAAGMDVCAEWSGAIQTILPGCTVMVPTGFAVEVPEGYELQCRPRSGLARDGITVANAPGTIDSDYRGEIKVLLHNQSRDPYTPFNGSRIAQLVLAPVTHAVPTEVDELSTTVRGENGFGSTGR